MSVASGIKGTPLKKTINFHLFTCRTSLSFYLSLTCSHRGAGPDSGGDEESHFSYSGSQGSDCEW